MDLKIYCDNINIYPYSCGRAEVTLNNIQNEINIIEEIMDNGNDNIKNDILEMIGWDYINTYFEISKMIDEAVKDAIEDEVQKYKKKELIK